jgi:hypothetical protein
MQVSMHVYMHKYGIRISLHTHESTIHDQAPDNYTHNAIVCQSPYFPIVLATYRKGYNYFIFSYSLYFEKMKIGLAISMLCVSMSVNSLY